jgi:hypothetical protein
MEFNEREKLIFLYANITSKLRCLDIHLSCRRNDNLDFDYVRETIKDLSETSPGAFLDILWPSAEKIENPGQTISGLMRPSGAGPIELK